VDQIRKTKKMKLLRKYLLSPTLNPTSPPLILRGGREGLRRKKERADKKTTNSTKLVVF